MVCKRFVSSILTENSSVVLSNSQLILEIFHSRKFPTLAELRSAAISTCELKFLGGDPSAGSPTDTLWRLNLPCLTKIRPWRASTMQNLVGLTGGECTGHWPIHGTLIKSHYYEFQRHEGELQPSIWTKVQFMRLASPFGVAALWMHHCRARVAQGIWDVLT